MIGHNSNYFIHSLIQGYLHTEIAILKKEKKFVNLLLRVFQTALKSTNGGHLKLLLRVMIRK